MAKTQNQYSYPVDLRECERITYDESPAHVGPLKESVDFICALGTPVYAAADGKVIYVKVDSDVGGVGQEFEEYGNGIEILHENDEYSWYEHLQKDGAVVEVNDEVKQGQLIGYSGATGWMAHLGPHLHFMVGKYGATEDQYQTLEIVWDLEAKK